VKLVFLVIHYTTRRIGSSFAVCFCC
jgi:hypothetical protein